MIFIKRSVGSIFSYEYKDISVGNIEEIRELIKKAAAAAKKSTDPEPTDAPNYLYNAAVSGVTEPVTLFQSLYPKITNASPAFIQLKNFIDPHCK